MYIKSHKELIVWQKSMELVKELYLTTNQLPQTEIFCLTSQMRRAAISIPSNIAEGHSRKNLKEYLQFLRIAYGSATELETQIMLCRNLYDNLDYKKTDLLLEEILKMLNVIIRKLGSN